MAEPLDFDPKALLPTPRERLEAGAGEGADALLEALDLLRELHERRVLSTLVRLVRGGEGLTAQLLDALNGEASVRAVRNALELAAVLGSVDPDDLRALGGALADGVREGARRARAGERAGLADLVALSRDPDVGLALGALVGLLRGLGRGLRERS